MSKIIFSIALASLLAACAVGPEYRCAWSETGNCGVVNGDNPFIGDNGPDAPGKGPGEGEGGDDSAPE